jgi:DNA-directed RNA polymerase specialized sigma24 family protein
MLAVYDEYRDIPRSTAGDVTGTAVDNLMLDVETAFGRLPPVLARPIHYYYRRDMGRRGAARACGLTELTFDARLNLAYYHLARLLRGTRG